MNALSKNIKKLRSLKGMSQAKFAQLFELTRANIGSYEEGRAQPKMEVVMKMSNYFNISLDAFVNSELSVNDLSNFRDIPETNLTPEIPETGAFRHVPYVTSETIGKYFSLGRSTHVLTVPNAFDASFAYALKGHHLEARYGISDGTILFLERIDPSEIQPGFLHAFWLEKKLWTGIVAIQKNTFELYGTSRTHPLTSIPQTTLKKAWRIVSTLSVQKTDFNYVQLERRIDTLEDTVANLRTSQLKK